MKAYKPMNRSELNAKLLNAEARLRKGNFENHLYLTAYTLKDYGMDSVTIQSILNQIVNHYDCILAGTCDITDFISECWDEFGFKFVNGDIVCKKTANDEAIENEILKGE